MVLLPVGVLQLKSRLGSSLNGGQSWVNTHMEPVLEVVASVFLLHNPVKNDKRGFIVCFSPNPVLKGCNPDRFSVLPGRKRLSPRQVGTHFPPSRTENPAALQPSSTGFRHPWGNGAQTREAQGPLHCQQQRLSTCRWVWLWQVLHLYHTSNTTLLWLSFTTKECPDCTRAELKGLSTGKCWQHARIVSAPSLNRNHHSLEVGCVWFSQ